MTASDARDAAIGSTPPGAGAATARACDACLRRAWLLARLSGWIEHVRYERATLSEVLALDDRRLVRGVAPDDADRILAERAAFDAAAARAAVERAGAVAVCRHDAAFPPRLLHAADAPAALFACGPIEHLAAFHGDERSVAIVGTRRASPDGLEVARALGRDLALAGVPVVSGMALGIDSAAQTGALDAGGLSVAVLAGGPERPYPPSKHRLHAALLQRGLVVSELPPGTRPRRWTFPARNRIIAALADLIVVVEAGRPSGSLITADLALRLGREVAAIPGPVLSARHQGTNALLRDGATLVRGVDDVLDALYGAGAAPRIRRAPGANLEPRLQAVLAALQDGRDTVGALAAGDPERAAEATAALAELEIQGLVARRPGGRYGLVL
jgi:DNA processing protein